jgi:hypothetical protein
MNMPGPLGLVLLVLLLATSLYALVPTPRRDMRPWVLVVTVLLTILLVGISFNN